MSKKARLEKRNTVQSIISRVLITLLVGGFIIAFISAAFLSYKSWRVQKRSAIPIFSHDLLSTSKGVL